jgi:hypothetical protein
LEVVGLTHEQFRDFVFLIIGWFIGKGIDDFIKDRLLAVARRDKVNSI